MFSRISARLRAAFGQQPHRRAYLAGRTVAALEGVALYEGVLQRMQRVTFGQALNGGDFSAVERHGEQ
jgi:hypothetical protein